MNINFNKIKEIYGNEILNMIKENQEIVIKNIKYLYSLGFRDIEDIFERAVLLFIDIDFKNKMDNLILKLGPDYVDIIENDLSLLEEIL